MGGGGWPLELWFICFLGLFALGSNFLLPWAWSPCYTQEFCCPGLGHLALMRLAWTVCCPGLGHLVLLRSFAAQGLLIATISAMCLDRRR